MNRQQRRQQARLNRTYRPGDLDGLIRQSQAEAEAKKRLERNGITIADLEENFSKGYKAGVNDTSDIMAKAAYSAAMLALRKTFRFGRKRMLRFISEMDSLMVSCIDREDMIDEACRTLGLRFQPEAGVDRFEEA